MHILILSGGEPEGTIGSDAAVSFKFHNRLEIAVRGQILSPWEGSVNSLNEGRKFYFI